MPYSGTLVTRVFTSRGQIPVPDAFVAVVQHGTDGDALLAVRTSDCSGNTFPITIETPAPQGSQAPSSGVPFAVCDIWAKHEGYQLLVVRDVQIFPNTLSIQELPLIPQNTSAKGHLDSVTIPPQDL